VAPAANAKDSHAILHLLGNLIIAHHCLRIAQSAAFPLDDEAPQRVAGLCNQFSSDRVRDLPVAIVLAQGGERRFERAAGTPKRRGLFLRHLIIERVGNGSRTAAEWDHLQADIVFTAPVVRAGRDTITGTR